MSDIYNGHDVITWYILMHVTHSTREELNKLKNLWALKGLMNLEIKQQYGSDIGLPNSQNVKIVL